MKRNEMIETLIKAGANRWTKNGKDRLYLSRAGEYFGFERASRYAGYGQSKRATLDGEPISNTQAYGIEYELQGLYIDLDTMTVHTDGGSGTIAGRVQALLDSISEDDPEPQAADAEPTEADAETETEAEMESKRQARASEIDGLPEVTAWYQDYKRFLREHSILDGDYWELSSALDDRMHALFDQYPQAAAYIRIYDELDYGDDDERKIRRQALDEVLFGDWRGASDRLKSRLQAYQDTLVGMEP